MYKIVSQLILLLLVSGCSIMVPPGTYSTANGISFAGTDFTLTDNGRFQYRSWSDNHPGTIGHGAYVIIGNNLLFVFENAKSQKSSYTISEIKCSAQDSQVVNFKLSQPSGEPIAFASLYNKQDHNQGTITLLDGQAQITIPKTTDKKVFIPHYIWIDDMEIEFDGGKCLDIDVVLKNEIDRLQLGHAKAIKIKREDDQLYIKMPNWKKYNEIYLKND